MRVEIGKFNSILNHKKASERKEEEGQFYTDSIQEALNEANEDGKAERSK